MRESNASTLYTITAGQTDHEGYRKPTRGYSGRLQPGLVIVSTARLQKSFDLPLENRYIRRANVLGFDAAIAVYQESDRQAENSPVKFTYLRVAHGNRIIHVETLVEVADGLRFVVHGNADDL